MKKTLTQAAENNKNKVLRYWSMNNGDDDVENWNSDLGDEDLDKDLKKEQRKQPIRRIERKNWHYRRRR